MAEPTSCIENLVGVATSADEWPRRPATAIGSHRNPCRQGKPASRRLGSFDAGEAEALIATGKLIMRVVQQLWDGEQN